MVMGLDNAMLSMTPGEHALRRHGRDTAPVLHGGRRRRCIVCVQSILFQMIEDLISIGVRGWRPELVQSRALCKLSTFLCRRRMWSHSHTSPVCVIDENIMLIFSFLPFAMLMYRQKKGGKGFECFNRVTDGGMNASASSHSRRTNMKRFHIYERRIHNS